MSQEVTAVARPGVVELRAAAEPILLDTVRQAPRLHFTKAEVTDYEDARKIRKALGLPKDDRRELVPILTVAASKLNKKLRSFRVAVEASGYSQAKLTASLCEGAEWKEAVDEAWSYSESPNELALTDPALGLLEFVRSRDLEPDYMLERSISWKMGLNGRERCIEPYLRELETKAKIGLRWERKGKQWEERPMYRLWVDSSEQQSVPEATALNPKIDRHLDRFTNDDLIAMRTSIYNWLLELNPSGTDDVHFLSIGSRAQLQHCLPHAQSRSSRALAEFFSSIPLNPAIGRGYDFREEAVRWTVTLHPKPDWESALAGVREELSQPSLQERFGLSDDAAKLLKWIEALPEDKKLLGRVTPIVEESATKFIGIKCPWSEDNTAVYLQLLIDEINEHTGYDLKLQPWHEYNRVRSRILIKRRRQRVEEVVSYLRSLAAEQGRSLNIAHARELVARLVADSAAE